MPRDEYFAALFIVGALNGLGSRIIETVRSVGWTEATLSTFGTSAIVWVAFYAGIRLVLQASSEKLRTADLVVGLGLLIPISLPIGGLSWVAISVLSRGSAKARRRRVSALRETGDRGAGGERLDAAELAAAAARSAVIDGHVSALGGAAGAAVIDLAVEDNAGADSGAERCVENVGVLPCPAPQSTSARPAALASLSTRAGTPKTRSTSAASGKPRQQGRFGGLMTTPRMGSSGPGEQRPIPVTAARASGAAAENRLRWRPIRRRIPPPRCPRRPWGHAPCA